jgi:glycosidase
MLHPRPSLSRTTALTALLLCTCSPAEAPPARECRAIIWARPEHGGAPISVVGSWDDWASPAPLSPYGEEDWQVRVMALPPGEYGYRVIEEGTARLDPENPLSTYQGAIEVSLLVVPSCFSPELKVLAALGSDEGQATVRGTFLTAASGAPLDPATLNARLEDGAALTLASADPAQGSFSFSASALEPGKHTVVIEASDRDGQAAAKARVAVWIKPAMRSWSDGVLYHIMIDRFRGDGGAALAPPKTPGTRAGGTLDGVRAEIERGMFDELGVTALWLSPVYRNPEGLFTGKDGHAYEPYHGYWPLDDREVDAHLGGAAALEAVIDAAHRRGIRVLLDFVPNHVHEENPRYLAHRGDGFFHDGPDKCVCGEAECGWGDHLLTCWFSPYLPDVRWEQPEQLRLGAGDARFWMEEFNADGIRIDAVPMMPRAATRRIAAALRESEAPGDALFTLGEVFTGPGEEGIDTIRYFLGPDGIDAAFDFPLMWATRDAFGTHKAGFPEVESLLHNTEDKLRGSGAILGLMLDNHDTSRFISEADGTAAVDPWSAPPPQPSASAPYRRQEMALAFLFTLPGLPVLYHGDEIALAGATDPDSRRVIPSLSTISPDQARVRETVRRLAEVRRCLKSLRTGDRIPLSVEEDTYAYLRDAGDGLPAFALFSRSASSTSIALPAGKTPAGNYQDAFTGAPIALEGGAPVPMDPESFKLIIPASSPCPPNLK